MAWRMALLGNTMAHGGQASVEAHKGGSTGNSLTKNGASGWLCRRPALPSAVGSIGIEPTADGPWRRLSGAQLGPWAHPSGASRENGHGVACNRKRFAVGSRGTICSFRKFMVHSWEWNDFWHHPARPNMTRIATGAWPFAY